MLMSTIIMRRKLRLGFEQLINLFEYYIFITCDNLKQFYEQIFENGQFSKIK